jgi:hypothetical protein
MAADIWTVKDRIGQRRRVRIEVGQPQPIPFDEKRDWFCPVFIEGFTPHVVPAFGVGPIDSLMNAVTLLRGFRDHIAMQQIEFGKRARTPFGRSDEEKGYAAPRKIEPATVNGPAAVGESNPCHDQRV